MFTHANHQPNVCVKIPIRNLIITNQWILLPITRSYPLTTPSGETAPFGIFFMGLVQGAQIYRH